MCFIHRQTFGFHFGRLTVRFMKLRNFFSISVMMEKSPFGRLSLTVVTFNWRAKTQRGREKETEDHRMIQIRNQKTEHPIKIRCVVFIIYSKSKTSLTASFCVCVCVCVCVCHSQGSPDTGSPAAVLCRRPRCCPPCASLHAAELRGRGRR